MAADGVFYWYGENKELTDGENGIWWNGVRCYSSRDLYNWKSEGIIIPADTTLSPTLAQTSQADRPHILFCKATGRFVCWIKIMEKDGTQDYTILSAEHLLGPYPSLLKCAGASRTKGGQGLGKKLTQSATSR